MTTVFKRLLDIYNYMFVLFNIVLDINNTKKHYPDRHAISTS